jgi:hypothetical protein
MIEECNMNVEFALKRQNYEEPAQRQIGFREEIPRLNPIDFESYKITNKVKTLSHIDSVPFKNSQKRISNDSIPQDFNIKNILNQNRSNYDQSIKDKANSRVMEFLNDFKPKVFVTNSGSTELLQNIQVA